MDYMEIAKRLRNYEWERDDDGKCYGCHDEESYYPCCVDCFSRTHRQAADAIETLANWWSMAKTLSDMVMPKWIPVTERLPKYGTPVLAYGSRGGIFVAKYERARAEWDRDYWWKLNSSIHVCNPTHWMPLPKPPKEEADA